MRSPSEERACYDEDLAFIQSSGFGELAAAAIAAVITQKPMRVDAASQVGAQLAFNVARYPAFVSGASLHEKTPSIVLVKPGQELAAGGQWPLT